MLKKGDIIFVVFILALALAGMAAINVVKNSSADKSLVAVVKQRDKIIERINLANVTEQRRIEVDGLYNESILVEKGRIRFEDADCPDRICVNTGWLEKVGDIAVCIPNQVMIRIEGSSGELDGIAQ